MDTLIRISNNYIRELSTAISQRPCSSKAVRWLLSVIHQLIEEKQGYMFVLTGSSARKLKKTGVDMLGGRALLRTMHPFMASELGERFCLEEGLHLATY